MANSSKRRHKAAAAAATPPPVCLRLEGAARRRPNRRTAATSSSVVEGRGDHWVLHLVMHRRLDPSELMGRKILLVPSGDCPDTQLIGLGCAVGSTLSYMIRSQRGQGCIISRCTSFGGRSFVRQRLIDANIILDFFCLLRTRPLEQND